MREITKTVKVYTFDKLGEKAKYKVKEWLDPFEFGAECTLEDFQEVAAILGFSDVTPRYSGFWSQGDGASFTGHYSYAKGAAKAIRVYAGKDETLWAIADGLQVVQAKHFYKLSAVLTVGSHHYAHENTIDFEVLKGEDHSPEDANQTVKDLCKDLMRWFYKQLEAEYDWCNDDEQVSETCQSNGYEFDEAGKLI